MTQEEADDLYIDFVKNTYEAIRVSAQNPSQFVLFFGAGASYGSDNSRLVKSRQLPPLGKDLYTYLSRNINTKYWKTLPLKLKTLFNEDFEQALKFLMDNDETYNLFYKLLLELAFYFAEFKVTNDSLYFKFAQRLYQKKTKISIISLNYDHLLQDALSLNQVMPTTLGVHRNDLHGEFKNFIPVDVIYPHGASQFSFYFPKEWEHEIYRDKAEIMGPGVWQFYEIKNMLINYIKLPNKPQSMPLMCAYEPGKRPFSENDFIQMQQIYYEQTILLAKRIVLVGVNCNNKNDRHLWASLEKTKAEIIFIEPSDSSISEIEKWNPNAKIIQKTFKDGFNDICELVSL